MSQPDQTSCPVCGSKDLYTTDGIPHPSCNNCGNFVDGNAEGDPLTDNRVASEDSTSKEWSSYSKIANSTEKRVAVAIELVEKFADQLDFDLETRERAVEIYSDVAIAGQTDGRPTETIVAVALYLAAREVSRPLPVNYLVRELDVPSSDTRRLIRVLQSELELDGTLAEPADYLDHLNRSANTAQESKYRACSLLDSLGSQITFSGKHPGSIAAAALYLESDSSTTQRELARAAGVTEETIRVRIKEFREVIS